MPRCLKRNVEAFFLEEIDSIKKGGGTTISFDDPNHIVYKELPYKLEAGTQNIAGAIGFMEAINYINKIGIDNIEEYIDKRCYRNNVTHTIASVP